LQLVPELLESVRRGKREERFAGTGDQPNFFRKPFGPGWALVGDARYQKDAIGAQGISDAFRDVELLTDALDAGFSGTKPLNDALAEYEKKRNETVQPMYEFNCEMASLDPPPPERQQLFAALRENQSETNRRNTCRSRTGHGILRSGEYSTYNGCCIWLADRLR
jgi:2-polyprenyl-6-methoxyphenol hydroxylase-like FAD-dependent oxidoreductase